MVKRTTGSGDKPTKLGKSGKSAPEVTMEINQKIEEKTMNNLSGKITLIFVSIVALIVFALFSILRIIRDKSCGICAGQTGNCQRRYVSA